MENFITATYQLLSIKFLGIEVFDAKDFFELIFRFFFNLVIIFVIVRLLYYPKTKRRDYLFTYFLISTTVFLICYLLNNVKLQTGFALGLFAIFGIIRYRTDSIPIKEMTYLFLVIGISVINALSNKKISYTEILFTNFILLIITFVLEHVTLIRHESTRTIEYEKIDLIKKDRRSELIKDLEERTGFKINRVEIGRINFLRDTVRLKIYYFETDEASIYNTDDYGSGIRDDD
jgi:hypothetical protein